MGHREPALLKVFRAELGRHTARGAPRPRRWIYVPYDQLTHEFGPLSESEPSELGILLIESPEKASRRPYHKQKLALVLANMRHFAIEEAARGVIVRYEVASSGYAEVIAKVAAEVGPLEMMVPAERELRIELAPLVESGALRYVAHAGWLTTRDDFVKSQNGPPWRMDAFYRQARRVTGLLMSKGKPEGGKWSFDVDNRARWNGKPPAPEPPSFVPDAITREVVELVERDFGRHPGRLCPESLPATREDAEHVWQWAKDECLQSFGPYEDAMSLDSRRLFHSGVSQLVNLSRLSPKRLVTEMASSDAPLSSREGFVRQILGWREFVHHVHVATDGFRSLEGVARRPIGDGGFARWSKRAWRGTPVNDSSAAPSFLGAADGVPVAYWGEPSGFRCVDEVIESVWDEGYSHHITRLMILSNWATLLEISPRELTDWFWVAYTDAFDWVVEPNVLGMGTFAAGELMTTKPYVAGAAYVARMSDYCKGCAFDPRSTCPLTRLYWAFLARHDGVLAGNQRMSLPLASARRRSPEDKARDRATFERVRLGFARGERLTPKDLVDPVESKP